MKRASVVHYLDSIHKLTYVQTVQARQGCTSYREIKDHIVWHTILMFLEEKAGDKAILLCFHSAPLAMNSPGGSPTVLVKKSGTIYHI